MIAVNANLVHQSDMGIDGDHRFDIFYLFSSSQNPIIQIKL